MERHNTSRQIAATRKQLEKEMTRYTELRHNGYYADNLTDAQRQAIADKVDGNPNRTVPTKGSTTSKSTGKSAT